MLPKPLAKPDIHDQTPAIDRRPSISSLLPQASQGCGPLTGSLADLDLSTASLAPILISVRVIVLSHLAELERRLAHAELPSTGSLKSRGGGAVEEVRVWAGEAVDMLRRIRQDVCLHIPELPFDGHVEEFLAHLSEFPYPALMEDLKSRLPEISRRRMPDLHLPNVQSRIRDIRSHLPDMSIDLSQSMNYLPILSRHLRSLHIHLSSVKSYPDYTLSSLPSTSKISEFLDRILSSNKIPAMLHRADGNDHPLKKAAKDVAVALKKSLNGTRLVTYVDLPHDWRNNPWVLSGYRFIPLHKWEIILFSLFALHNETLNIHTHMIPLLHTAFRYTPFFKEDFEPIDRPELIYTLFAMMCLFSSVVWHTMSGCAHFVGMDFCARVDYVGIGWLISASVWTIVHYGFSCYPEISFFFKTLCLATGVAGSIFPFMRWFNDVRYKPLRIVTFLGMAFTGLAPIAQLSFQHGFLDMLSFINPIAPSLASYIIGLCFYASHFPESYFNNARIAYWTDWIGGGSHAIWHVFIVCAIYQHKWGMREMNSGVAGRGCLAN